MHFSDGVLAARPGLYNGVHNRHVDPHVPRPAQGNHAADGLRDHARPAADHAHRGNAVDDHRRPRDCRPQAGHRADPARRHRHERRPAGPGAIGTGRAHRRIPRSRHPPARGIPGAPARYRGAHVHPVRSDGGDRQLGRARGRRAEKARRHRRADHLPVAGGGAGRRRGVPEGAPGREDLLRVARFAPGRPRLHRAGPGRRGRPHLRAERQVRRHRARHDGKDCPGPGRLRGQRRPRPDAVARIAASLARVAARGRWFGRHVRLCHAGPGGAPHRAGGAHGHERRRRLGAGARPGGAIAGLGGARSESGRVRLNICAFDLPQIGYDHVVYNDMYTPARRGAVHEKAAASVLQKSSVSGDFFSSVRLVCGPSPGPAPVVRLRVGAAQEVHKRPYAQRQVPALREYRVDIVARRRVIGQHRVQLARLDLAAHFPHRPPRQPFAGQCPLVQDLAVVAAHVAAHFHHHVLAVFAEGPAALAAFAADGQAVMARQVGQRVRRAVPLQVGGRSHHHPFVVGQLDADQAGVRQAGDADRNVDALADDIGHAVRHVERGGEVAVFRQERGQQRRHVLAAETGWRRDHQVAGGLGAAFRHGRFGLFQLCQDALAVFEKCRTLVGERQLAGGTLQQLDAQPRLERVEPAPDHGRRNALGAGRCR
uniref:Uncharacterized protein n=1 Tax=Tanacetum cinerariifolium TaxID=118510 RepID=A0A699GEV6_TANCI|nr:hypothetical protein [Tanacetum cinerariifolium]